MPSDLELCASCGLLYANLNVVGLRRCVETCGIACVSMQTLRDMIGFSRLGHEVRAKISSKLSEYGLAHTPDDLPVEQDAEALVYLADSTIGKVVSAFRSPSKQSADTLRSLLQSDALDKLDKIKAIIE